MLVLIYEDIRFVEITMRDGKIRCSSESLLVQVDEWVGESPVSQGGEFEPVATLNVFLKLFKFTCYSLGCKAQQLFVILGEVNYLRRSFISVPP